MDPRTLAPLLPPKLAAQLPQTLQQLQWDKGQVDGWDVLVHLHETGALTLSELIDVAGRCAAAQRKASGLRTLVRLGQGAMGDVDLAVDLRLGRVVARKQLKPALQKDAQARARFLSEARLTGRLEHPSIVTVYGQEDGAAGAYWMPVIRGRTLAEMVREAIACWERRSEPPDDLATSALLDAFLDACDAVSFAHQQGVLHRDLKPDNIMVGAFGQVLVLDWGLADDLDNPDAARERHSGTPSYMAPEQARGEEQGPAADQYALGRILHELVTLNPPLRGASGDILLARASAGHREPVVHRFKRPLPRELVAIVEKATDPEPARRYPSVNALARDVRRQRADQEVLARPDTRVRAWQRWIGHHRELTLAALLGLGLLLLASVLGVGTLGIVSLEISRQRSQAREARMAVIMDQVVRQGHRLDAGLARSQGLLQGVVTTAEQALATEPEPARIYFTEDWQAPETAPPDRIDSPLYEVPVSLGHPDVVRAPGVTVSERELQQLVSLTPTLARTALRSAGEPALAWSDEARVERVTVSGLPIVWVYLATETGAMVGWPGTSEPYPDDYDPRTRPWYRVAADAGEPTWSALDEDESGQGLLLTCSAPVRGPAGEQRGVAAIDLPFAPFITTWLVPDELPQGAEAFLVDDKGLTVMRSTQAEDAHAIDTYRPEPFPLAVHLGASSTGYVTVDDQLLAWSRLEALPWRLVVVGEEAALLSDPAPPAAGGGSR